MQTHFSEYIPLALLIAFAAFSPTDLAWQLQIGAYIRSLAASIFPLALVIRPFILVVMVTTWVLTGSTTFLMLNAVVMQSIGATLGFVIVKRYGTSVNQVKPFEIALSLVLGVIGAYVGFVLFKDATFAADFVTNANSVAGAYFGAVLMGNSPLIVGGLARVLRNQEP